MNIHDKHSLATNICRTFESCFQNCTVRFGRTSKIEKKFEGRISRLSWAICERKGGGFTIWLDYAGAVARPHHAVLQEMVRDYSTEVDRQRYAGGRVKAIRNKAVNISKDLEILVGTNWCTVGTLFPIFIRELRSAKICRQWIDHHSQPLSIDVHQRILYLKYLHLGRIYHLWS